MHPERILVASALFLWGCTNAEPPPTEYSVAMDPAFTNDQTEALVAAFEDWKAAVPQLTLSYSIAACSNPAPQQVCVHPVTAPPDAALEIIGETYPGPSASATQPRGRRSDRIRGAGLAATAGDAAFGDARRPPVRSDRRRGARGGRRA